MSQTPRQDVYVQVTTANGTRYSWDANQLPGSRPLNANWRTQAGEGFSDAAVTLARRTDRDYEDLNLGDTLTFTDAYGNVVYEGRIEGLPRDLSDQHQITVQLVGWMAHAKDRTFRDIIVDRDASQWGAMPLERQAAVLTAADSTGDFSYQSEQGGLVCPLPNQALGSNTLAEAWYQAPSGVKIAKIGYKGTTTSLPTGWTDVFGIAADRAAATVDTFTPTLDNTLRTITATTARQYAFVQTFSAAHAVTPASGASIQISKIAVYGNHGLTLRTGDPNEPAGVYLSDIIVYIANQYAPLLDTSGVQTNTYVVQHAAYADRTAPYDAFTDLNKYAVSGDVVGWKLAVWEGKRLTFEPYDLTDYDWEIRTDDPGTTFSWQGQTLDDVYNGIVVTYTDPATGVQADVTPSDTPALADGSPWNPWNKIGVDHWKEIAVSTPVLANQATQIGRAALAGANIPTTPGTISITGHVRDRTGNPQPVSRVRADDRILISNFPNDTPRLIVGTDYDHESTTNRLSIDRPAAAVDALLARLVNAATALGGSV